MELTHAFGPPQGIAAMVMAKACHVTSQSIRKVCAQVLLLTQQCHGLVEAA